MATTITNDASTTYSLSGETNTISSNENSVVLEDSVGLALTKTASQTNFVPGDIISYTVTITNNSTSFFNGVRIVDDLGGGNLAYVVGSGRLTIGTTSYAVSPVATSPLTFTLQQLNVGQTMTLTYRCQVIFNLPSNINTITNTVRGTAYISSGTIIAFASASIQRTTTGDLSITKAASTTNIFRNQPFRYFLTLTNSSGEAATISEVVDQLPSNFVVNTISLRIGSGPDQVLAGTDYTLSASNLLTIPSASGPTITVPAGGSTVITILGSFV